MYVPCINNEQAIQAAKSGKIGVQFFWARTQILLPISYAVHSDARLQEQINLSFGVVVARNVRRLNDGVELFVPSCRREEELFPDDTELIRFLQRLNGSEFALVRTAVAAFQRGDFQGIVAPLIELRPVFMFDSDLQSEWRERVHSEIPIAALRHATEYEDRVAIAKFIPNSAPLHALLMEFWERRQIDVCAAIYFSVYSDSSEETVIGYYEKRAQALNQMPRELIKQLLEFYEATDERGQLGIRNWLREEYEDH